MKELGGYFELELSQAECYHKGALALNSARNCLKYILKAQKPNKVYLPAYCCDSLIEPLISENIDYQFYHIDGSFELLELPELRTDERLLYINYFALKAEYLKVLYKKYGFHLIVDNTQAFFEMPINGVDTFYSPRKFFGVADGGYLYTTHLLNEELQQDQSVDRFAHLLGRYETNASAFYNDYKIAENSIINQSIKWMSKLTQGILKSLDYEKIILQRQRNFWVLDSQLNASNLFTGIELNDFVPMVYPYLSKDESLRDRLIKNKAYIAKYWEDAQDRVSFVEQGFINTMFFLSVDQRCNLDDLNRVVGIVTNGQ